MANEQMFRVTRPERYKANCPGRENPGARQGYYVQAENVAGARVNARQEYSVIDEHELLDVQDWNNGQDHGRLLDEGGMPRSKAFFG